MGNGLRPDVWPEFKQRFGIKRIAEFYGASEGNVAFANLLNKDCTVGMTSVRHALVRYDIDADEIVRDPAGRCIPVEPGEPGLLLGHISPEAIFEGYTNPEATEKKIVRDAFEAGDAWFNSGDLMRQIDAGFTLGYPHYQFVDRIGDTFRWKSENVSTNEVGEIINGFPQIRFSNVYGVTVPGADGRAGMAALTLEDGVTALDIDAFSDYVTRELPSYARPLFLRIEQEIDVTGTFKMVKGKLRDEGYDPARISDPLYVMKPGSSRYEPLDPAYAAVIARGDAGF
jgi:citronellyl-CoA synthetase